ncbi:MAG TPA: hypothetical protein VIL31_03440 [Cyclobacteriaceae bacterium]|jgi:hypothetical protein
MYTDNKESYVYLWSKYRPVLLKLMSAAAIEPQDYRLYAHEFQSLNPRQKGGYTFTLEARGGKAINNIRKSPVAMDLLQVLQLSPRAVELMEEATYELSMDKNFILHVNRKEDIEKEVIEEKEKEPESDDDGMK